MGLSSLSWWLAHHLETMTLKYVNSSFPPERREKKKKKKRHASRNLLPLKAFRSNGTSQRRATPGAKCFQKTSRISHLVRDT